MCELRYNFLQRLCLWLNSGSHVIDRNALVQSDFMIFHQYLLKKSINILKFLHGDIHKGKVTSETTRLISTWSGVPQICQNLSRLDTAAFQSKNTS